MPVVLLLLSVVAAAVPMTAFVVAVWWLDRYEREPPLLVLGVFGWGAVGAVVLALIGSGVLGLPVSLLPDSAGALLGPVVIAPLVEEPAKALVLLLLLLQGKHFDGATDGFVYGAAAGLGFGMTENFLYFTGPAISGDVGGWIGLVLLRTGFSAVMHAMCTSTVGACLGAARFRGGARLGAAGAVGLALAMAMHATWNGLISFDPVVDAGGALAGLDLLLLMAGFVVVMLTFQIAVLLESARIRRELLAEVALGTLSHEVAVTLSSWTARTFRRWAPVGVRQDVYTAVAMKLALRRHQAALLARRGKDDGYAAEVTSLRARLIGLWASAEVHRG